MKKLLGSGIDSVDIIEKKAGVMVQADRKRRLDSMSMSEADKKAMEKMKASIKEGNGNAAESSEEEEGEGKLKEEERSLIVEEILKANDGMDFVLEDMMT